MGHYRGKNSDDISIVCPDQHLCSVSGTEQKELEERTEMNDVVQQDLNLEVPLIFPILRYCICHAGSFLTRR